MDLPAPDDRLDSWKEIAAFLGRTVRTVQRWEKTQGLPLHRGGPEDFVHDGRSGHLVPCGDAESMAKRLVDVFSMTDAEWRRMSDASYAIARRFAWPQSARQLERALLQHLGQAELRSSAPQRAELRYGRASSAPSLGRS